MSRGLKSKRKCIHREILPANHVCNNWITFGENLVVFIGKIRGAVKLQGSKEGHNLTLVHGNWILVPKIDKDDLNCSFGHLQPRVEVLGGNCQQEELGSAPSSDLTLCDG
ncbi:hypothetical protein EK904_004375 [Melospiza melodia maxima]|nr:hypothetical protein EK904_004375 [Melospiza melodia maxima]